MMRLSYFLTTLFCILCTATTTFCTKTTLCGYTLACPIGVSACPLTNGSGIKELADLGYGVITYKTIRSTYQPITSPHLYHVDIQKQLTKEDVDGVFEIDEKPDRQNNAITNAYGINSLDTQAVINDIAHARSHIADDQVLIVSIYGSGNTEQEIIDDFVATARIAVAGGAQIVEANLSCPNIGHALALYKNPTLVYNICKAITTAVPEVPLAIKVGIFDTFEQTKSVVLAADAAGAQAICGINSMPARIVDKQNNPIYGESHLISGVSGTPLCSMALDFVKEVRAIIDHEQLSLALLATGGITKPEDFDTFLAAGADIALSATQVMANKHLAQEYHALHQSISKSKKELIRSLYTIGALKTGSFTLKSGAQSPIYCDMRLAISYPKLLGSLANELVRIFDTNTIDVICGVPHGAVPLATLMSSVSDIALIMPRKEIKTYGTQKAIEGVFKIGDRCVIVEDVISTGMSILETIKIVEDHGLIVTDIVVVIDREQGGKQQLEAKGYTLHPLFTLSEIAQILLDDETITDAQYAHMVQGCAHSNAHQ